MTDHINGILIDRESEKRMDIFKRMAAAEREAWKNLAADLRTSRKRRKE